MRNGFLISVSCSCPCGGAWGHYENDGSHTGCGAIAPTSRWKSQYVILLSQVGLVAVFSTFRPREYTPYSTYTCVQLSLPQILHWRVTAATQKTAVLWLRACDPVSDPSPSDLRCLSNAGTLQIALNFQNFFKLQPCEGELTTPQPGKYLISTA